jgi:hypothetical protein
MPNVQYFTKLLREPIIIEQHENYQKQTYRNRYDILTSNGILHLSVPVKHLSPKMKIREVEIDYTDNWQRLHWRTISTAYRSSPFFMYYSDDLLPLFSCREKYLFDLNCKTLDVLLSLIGIRAQISFSDDYRHDYELDYRDLISPKNKSFDPSFHPSPYYQLFFDKSDFKSNLSVLDLLCNEGNNSFSTIENSILTTTSFVITSDGLN